MYLFQREAYSAKRVGGLGATLIADRAGGTMQTRAGSLFSRKERV